MYVSGITTKLEIEITPSAIQYHANDVLGGLIELGPVLGADGGCVITNLELVDEDNEGAAIDVHIFDQQPATIADHAAFAPTYADLKKRVRRVQILAADYETVNSMKAAYTDTLYNVAPDSTKLWVYLVVTGAPTYAANKKLFLRLFILM